MPIQIADLIVQLAQPIQRAIPGAEVDVARLEERLLHLLSAVGCLDVGTEYTRAFREFAGHGPSHADLAKRLRAIATSDDPLNLAADTGVLLSELNALARNKWSRQIRAGRFDPDHPLRGCSTASLTPQEVADVRAMALHVAAYHQSFVQRGRPTKNDQNTLLLGLADIFIEFTGLDCSRHDLPHAENSQFITFVELAVRPFFSQTEATRASISRRWKRLKDVNRSG